MYRVLHTTPRTTASTTQDTYCGNEHINLSSMAAPCVRACVRPSSTVTHTRARPPRRTRTTRTRAGICRGFATKLQKEQEAEK